MFAPADSVCARSESRRTPADSILVVCQTAKTPAGSVACCWIGFSVSRQLCLNSRSRAIA